MEKLDESKAGLNRRDALKGMTAVSLALATGGKSHGDQVLSDVRLAGQYGPVRRALPATGRRRAQLSEQGFQGAKDEGLASPAAR